MPLAEYKGPTPEAFRGFIEGVQNLQDYLRTNSGEKLIEAEKQLDESLAADPDFIPAQYYKAIVLTHGRKSDDAIGLLVDLGQANPPFKAEVLYNLAFAYARKYEYEYFEKALKLLDDAYKLAHHRLAGWSIRAKRPDLVLLIKAMRAWVMAAFAGRTYGRKDDFEARQQEYLPGCILLTQSVLTDPRLESLAPETKRAIEVESHNAAGIAYMRMGQRSTLFTTKGNKVRPASWLDFVIDRSSELFGKSPEHYWKLAEQHYASALRVHPADVRVLDNISTLNLIQTCYALIHGNEETAGNFAKLAKNKATESISHNRNDRFRHYNLAKALALLDEWDAASQAVIDTRKEPGIVTDKQLDKFDEAIRAKDKNFVIKQYYDIPKESASKQLGH